MKDRLGSISGDSQHSASEDLGSPVENGEATVLSPSLSEDHDVPSSRVPTAPSRAVALSPSALSERPTSIRGRSPTASIRGSASAPNGVRRDREVEDYKTKLQHSEKVRNEEREKLKVLEKVSAERDKFESIIQKLQTKLQPQQREIADLKRQLREEEAKMNDLEARQAENDTINEMATLDREMAEETAESLKAELDALRQRHEELELEVEVLREENQELSHDMSPEEKASQGWLAMEREIERYREGLLVLRDSSREKERDLASQVDELQKDLQDMDKIKGEYQETKEKLLYSDATLEDLRQQLDTALGAEEMIEELTEKNMAMGEKMEELHQTIEDLESLKELNDELELNHTETEKQLQEEIDYSESLLAEEARKAAIQDGSIEDLEYTVTRFRELAKNMQGEIEEMRTSQQITETEASELNDRSRAMMDLNMRLQVSALKAQVKAIDLELGKMEAQQSSEHLSIVELFLPESFKSEQDSVQALLRFRRISFKAQMMHHCIKERLNGQSSPVSEEDIFPYCDILDKLTWVSSTCERFINHIRTCGLDSFRRLGGASYELEPVERGLNTWIDGLKRDELKGEQCSSELQRLIALMTHLAEAHIPEDLEHFADDVCMRAQMMQSQLENTAIALSRMKALSEAKIPQNSEENDKDNAEFDELLRKIDSIISQTRSAKVVSNKATRQVEDLKSRSLALDPSTLNTIETSETAVSELASSARNLGTSIATILSAEVGNKPMTPQELLQSIADQAPLGAFSNRLQAAASQVQTFYTLTSSLKQTVEFPSPPPPPPWKILAQTMRADTADMASREQDLARMRDEMAEKNNNLAMKEKAAEEMAVKIEVLEKRVGESGARREKFRELEEEINATKGNERTLQSKISSLQIELHTLEAEREKWKQTPRTAPTGPQPSHGAMPAKPSDDARRQINTLTAEIKTLQSLIRYLRSAAHSQNMSTNHTFLSTPIAPPRRTPPPLQTEAKDVLKEMLNVISQPQSQIVRLQPREKTDRLKWQPVRETSLWKLNCMKEDWMEWKEWRDDVARKVESGKREDERRRVVRMEAVLRRRGRQKGAGIAMADFSRKIDGDGGEVRIADPATLDDHDAT